MFRGKAVVDGEHAAAAGKCDLRDQVAVRFHRADAKAAAVEIQNGLIQEAYWPAISIRHRRRRRRQVQQVTGAVLPPKAASQSRAHLAHRRVAVPAAVDRADARDREIDRRRCDIFACARHISRPPHAAGYASVSPVI